MHNFWCTIDCGVAVQPDNVIAQQESSIVYGLGVTLTELITVKNGVVEQSNFYDYHVPRMRDRRRGGGIDRRAAAMVMFRREVKSYTSASAAAA